MKTRSIGMMAILVAVLTACEPSRDTSEGSTNNVSPTETNTVPEVNRPPEVVTNSIATNAAPAP